MSGQPEKSQFRSGSVNTDGDRGRLYYLIKLPQSGGSTFANDWVRASPIIEDIRRFPVQDSLPPYYGSSHVGQARPRVVLGGDDFRIGLHGQEYVRTAEGAVFAIMDAAARALLSRGFDVLMDETATTEQTLMRYYLIHFEAEPIFIPTPASVCEERALANKKDFLVPVIQQLAAQKDELLKDWPNAVDRVKARLLKRYPNFVVRGAE